MTQLLHVLHVKIHLAQNGIVSTHLYERPTLNKKNSKHWALQISQCNRLIRHILSDISHKTALSVSIYTEKCIRKTRTL